jgi:hypothetical protein
LTPLGAQLRVEHAVHLLGGQGRCVLLQLRQRFAIRLTELLGDGGLHHRQRLAHLHCAALEFAENGEQLIGGLLHQLGVDLVPRGAGESLAEAERSTSGEPDGKRSQLRVARCPTTLYVCHHSIIHDCATTVPVTSRTPREVAATVSNRTVDGATSVG